jgi:hypothetical protein
VLLVMAFVLMLSMPAMAFAQEQTDASSGGSSAPTIQSDKEDYPPGGHVVLTGSNWQPGESVNIYVNDDEGKTWSRNVDVTADQSGNVRDEFDLPDWFVATYKVTATGAQSGAVATTTFTDGNANITNADDTPSDVGATFTLANVGNVSADACPTATALSERSGTLIGPGGKITKIEKGQTVDNDLGANKDDFVRITPTNVSSGWKVKNYGVDDRGTKLTPLTPSATGVACFKVPANNSIILFTANYERADSTAPTTSATATKATDPVSSYTSGDWSNKDVTVTLSAKDNDGGVGVKEIRYTINNGAENVVAGASKSIGVTAEGTTTISYYAVDKNGNKETAKSFVIKIDKTKPVISGEDFVNSGWTNQDVSKPFTANDNLSGLTEADKSFTLRASAESTKDTNGNVVPTKVSRTVTDAAGNVSDSRSVTAQIDKTRPVIDGPDFENPGWTNQDVFKTFAANDALSGLAESQQSLRLTATAESTKDAGGNVVPTEVSGKVTDLAGNESLPRKLSAQIDKTKPVIEDRGATSGPDGKNGWYVSQVTNTFSASDGLSGFAGQDDPYTFEKTSGSDEGPAVKINPGTVTDRAGNESEPKDSAEFKIDMTAPEPPSKIDLVASSDTGDSNTDNLTKDQTPTFEVNAEKGSTVKIFKGTDNTPLGSATANDSGVATVTSSELSDGTYKVYAKATDEAGNVSESSATIKVTIDVTVDTTAPQLKLPADITEEATGPKGAAVSYNASASDSLDGDVAVQCSPESGATFPLGTTQVDCSASDKAGNKAEGSFTVKVQDTTAADTEILSGPNGWINKDSATFEWTGSDAVTQTASLQYSYKLDEGDWSTPSGDTSVTLENLDDGKHTFYVKAIDEAGNEDQSPATRGFGVDTKAPKFSDVPADMTVEATGSDGAKVSYAKPSANDNIDGNVAVDCQPPSDTVFLLGTTRVTCSAEDNAGNKDSASFEVKVQDTTAPRLNLPENKVEEATGPNGAAVNFAGTANDVVDGNVPVECLVGANPVKSGDTFPLGTTQVDCSATDKAGNKASDSFTVKVVDTTAPQLSLSKDLIAEATDANGAKVEYSAGANDIVDGNNVAVDCSPISGSTFPLGATTVDCSAKDNAGNKASGSFKVTVVDTTAPVISGVPSNMSVTATSSSGAVVNYTSLKGTDLVDGNVNVACQPASGTVFPLGTTQVDCSASDKAGNKAPVASFKVTVTYSWSNVLQPINPNGSSIFKLGSTVPVKFKLTGDSAAITNANAKLYVAKIDSGIAGAELEASSTAAADSGNTFRYDATNAQYIFNLGTKGLGEGTFRLRIDLGDGTHNTVLISLKK